MQPQGCVNELRGPLKLLKIAKRGARFLELLFGFVGCEGRVPCWCVGRSEVRVWVDSRALDRCDHIID